MKHLLSLLLFGSIIFGCQTNSSNENDKPISKDIDTNMTKVSDLVDSLTYLTRKLQADYDNPMNWYQRAKYLSQKGDLQNALLDIKEAVFRDTVTPKFRLLYADILLSKLELEAAKKHYSYVIHADSLNPFGYLGMGRIYAYLDNPGRATAYLDKAQKINPYLAESYYLEGLIYKADYYKTKREESWKRALSSFQTVIEQDPKHYNAYISLGVMKSERGEELALEYFNSALNIAPKSNEALYNIGAFYQSKNDLETAKTYYRQIIENDSMYAKAYYNQGYLKLVVDKDYDSSIYFFTKTLKIDSLNFKAFNNLGLAHEKNGDFKRAEFYYQKALKINPDFDLAKKNLNYVKKLK